MKKVEQNKMLKKKRFWKVLTSSLRRSASTKTSISDIASGPAWLREPFTSTLEIKAPFGMN